MFRNDDNKNELEARRQIIRQDTNFLMEQFEGFNEPEAAKMVYKLEPEMVDKIAGVVNISIDEPKTRNAQANALKKLGSKQTEKHEKKEIIVSLIKELNDDKKDEVMKELLEVSGTKKANGKVPDKFPGAYCVYDKFAKILREEETSKAEKRRIERDAKRNTKAEKKKASDKAEGKASKTTINIDEKTPAEMTENNDKETPSNDTKPIEQKTLEKDSESNKIEVPDFGIVIDRTINDIPKELKDFRIDVEETKDIIEVFYSDDNISKYILKRRRNERIREAWRSRDKHIFELGKIAADGLNNTNPKTDEASRRLEVLKDNILMQEGKNVKGRYLTKLTVWAVIFSVIGLIIGIISINISGNYGLDQKDDTPVTGESADEITLENNEAEETVPDDLDTILEPETTASAAEKTDDEEEVDKATLDYKGNIVYAYLFVFIGSLYGAIVSYIFRKEKIAFKDLVVMEEDMLNPLGRLLSTGLISIIFMLFITSKVFDMQIGGVPLESIWKPENFEYQLIIGVIAGLAGNGLAGKMYDKANSVVGIAGKK